VLERGRQGREDKIVSRVGGIVSGNRVVNGGWEEGKGEKVDDR